MRFLIALVALTLPVFAQAQSLRLGVQGGVDLATMGVSYPAQPSPVAGATSTLELSSWLALRVDLQLSDKQWQGARALTLETPAIVQLSPGRFGDTRPYLNAGYLRTVALKCSVKNGADAVHNDTRRVLESPSASTGLVGHDPLTAMRTSSTTSCMDVIGSTFNSGFLFGAGIAMRRRGGETAIEVRATEVTPQLAVEQFRRVPFDYPRIGLLVLVSTTARLH